MAYTVNRVYRCKERTGCGRMEGGPGVGGGRMEGGVIEWGGGLQGWWW